MSLISLIYGELLMSRLSLIHFFIPDTYHYLTCAWDMGNSLYLFELFITALHVEFVPDLYSDKLAESTVHPVDSLWSKLSVSFLLQALHAFGHLNLYLPPNALAYF